MEFQHRRFYTAYLCTTGEDYHTRDCCVGTPAAKQTASAGQHRERKSTRHEDEYAQQRVESE